MVADLFLRDGSALPALGFGMYKVRPDEAERVVLDGVAAGYRLVEGAEFYANEEAVGRALGQVDRDSLLVTSKFWGEEDQGRDALLRSFDASESALGRIDCYMLHWPRASRNQYVDAWRTLIELRDAGRVRLIGVSNFTEAHLRRLIEETGEAPAINQVESHPWLPQHELRAFHAAHGIVTQAWSPLGRGRLLEESLLVQIAQELGATAAQVILAWHLAIGGAAIPKSTVPLRLRSNLFAGELKLTDAHLAAISGLENGQRTGTHPDERQ